MKRAIIGFLLVVFCLGAAPPMDPTEKWLGAESIALTNLLIGQIQNIRSPVSNCAEWATALGHFRDPVAPGAKTRLVCRDDLTGDGYRIRKEGDKILIQMAYGGHSVNHEIDLTKVAKPKKSLAELPPMEQENQYCEAYARNWDGLIQAYGVIKDEFPKGAEDLQNTFGDLFANNPLIPGTQTHIADVSRTGKVKYRDKSEWSLFSVDWETLEANCPLPTSGTWTSAGLVLARITLLRLIRQGKEPVPSSELTRRMIGLSQSGKYQPPPENIIK